MKKLADSGVKKIEKDNVDTMIQWLESHPRACAHLLQTCVLQKAYDHLDNPDTAKDSEDEDERLPEWQNKFRLLSGPRTMTWLQELLPNMAEFLGQASNKKLKRDVPNEVLAFIVNADITSALPSKNVGDLKSWLHAEHKKHGCRLADFEPPEACNSLQD